MAGIQPGFCLVPDVLAGPASAGPVGNLTAAYSRGVNAKRRAGSLPAI